MSCHSSANSLYDTKRFLECSACRSISWADCTALCVSNVSLARELTCTVS